MKRLSGIAIAVLVLGVGAIALAQGGRGMHNYNPNTEVTVKGTVDDVQQHVGSRRRSGTHLVLTAESGNLPVHVGPAAYIAGQQFSFAKGEQVEVVGSKVSLDGGEAIIAREIKKDGRTLVLRNAQGVPEWAGARR